MDYQVWTKAEYGDTWQRTDCGDLAAAQRELLSAAKLGNDTILTVEVPFSLEMKVGEPGGEVKKTKPPKETPEEKAKREEAELEANKNKAKPD